MVQLTPKHIVQLPSAKVLAVAIHPEEKLCAAGDRDGFIHILDIQTGQVLRRLKQHVEFVYTLAFHSDNGHLLSAGKDKSIREWECETGQFIQDFAGIFLSASARSMGAQRFKPTTKSHKMTILSIASEKGGLMATGGQDALVKYWKDGEPIRTYDWHRGPVTCVRFQPETHILFSASKDKDIRSWNETTGAVIHKYSGHMGEIVGMEFVDPEHFVTVDALGYVIAWNVNSESPKAWLYEANARVQCATWMKAQKCLLLGFENGDISAIPMDEFTSPKNECYSCHHHETNVRCIKASDSGIIVSSDNSGKVIFWNYSA